MATLRELELSGCIHRLELSLRRREFEERQIWLLDAVKSWLEIELPAAKAYYPDSIQPKLQAQSIFKDFVTGGEFDENRMFRRMKPMEKDVYELKTDDLRIFGWFYRPRVFIIGCISTFEITHAADGIHNYFRDQTISLRDKIDLDEPKWVANAEPRDVF